MLNKSRICNEIRKRYPKFLGIRKGLQKIKVSRLTRHVLPKELIEKGEADPKAIPEIIAPYREKWSKYLRPAMKEIDVILKKSPNFSPLSDEEKEALTNDMLFCRLAYGFFPSEYTGFHFEKRSAEERKTFCSDIDMNIFGYSVNDISAIQHFLDKGESFFKAGEFNRREGIAISKKEDYEKYKAFVEKHPVFVKKKVFSSMGQGVELVDINKLNVSKEEYFRSLIKYGKTLLEERVIQSDELAKVNASSVNTVRCMTFNTKNGIVVPYCFFKAGRGGSFVDNAGAGGIVVGVDPATGTCITTGFTEYGESFIEHPETGIVFKGFQLPKWDELVSICKTLTKRYPEMKYLSFDMAYTKDEEWVVIEINEVGQFIIPQIVFQRGIRKELWDYFATIEKVF